MKFGDMFGKPKEELEQKIKDLKGDIDSRRKSYLRARETFDKLKEFGMTHHLDPWYISGKDSEVDWESKSLSQSPIDPDTHKVYGESMTTGFGWTANTGSIIRNEFWYGLDRRNDTYGDDICIADKLDVAKEMRRGQPGSSFADYDNYREEELNIVGYYGDRETKTVQSDRVKPSHSEGNKGDRGIKDWEKYKYLIQVKIGIKTSRDEEGFGAYSHGTAIRVYENDIT
ncbi:hypothetical protein KGY79_13440 [Candidatus Bipolaricaulota bacterium]|nr:hypothetical protein [Candidatus Bipolaricaulota bacterium]